MPKLEITAKNADSSTHYVHQKLLFRKRMIPPKCKDKEKNDLTLFFGQQHLYYPKEFPKFTVMQVSFSIILCQMQKIEKIGLHTF